MHSHSYVPGGSLMHTACSSHTAPQQGTCVRGHVCQRSRASQVGSALCFLPLFSRSTVCAGRRHTVFHRGVGVCVCAQRTKPRMRLRCDKDQARRTHVYSMRARSWSGFRSWARARMLWRGLGRSLKGKASVASISRVKARAQGSKQGLRGQSKGSRVKARAQGSKQGLKGQSKGSR
eukprot:414966-Rhodomonas_salina.1